MKPSQLTRREGLRNVIALALAPAGAALAQGGTEQGSAGGRKVLMAYMSRSGNTRLVAHQIARATQANLFEITTAVPYPEDYRQTVDQARRETEQSFEPPLQAAPSVGGNYDVVFLGFPIWGMTAPPPIRSFLSLQNFAGKTLVPFITHGGYGTGASLSVLAKLAPKARIALPFVLKCDQERDTLERVTQWLQRQPASG